MPKGRLSRAQLFAFGTAVSIATACGEDVGSPAGAYGGPPPSNEATEGAEEPVQETPPAETPPAETPPTEADDDDDNGSSVHTLYGVPPS